MSLIVQDAMTTEVVSIAPSESVENAAKIMDQRGISSLMVMSNETLQGIITERDILSRVVARGLKPPEVNVADVMSPSLITIGPDTTLEDANKIMVESRIKKLPVVEPETRRLLGILSVTDFARLQNRLIEDARRRMLGSGGGDVGIVALHAFRGSLVGRCASPKIEHSRQHIPCLRLLCTFCGQFSDDNQ
jgi:CBS domain-containing protein